MGITEGAVYPIDYAYDSHFVVFWWITGLLFSI